MKIFKVMTRYSNRKFPSCTGHRVAAVNAEDALRIAEKYGIACPFHRQVSSRLIERPVLLINPTRYYRGKVWMEVENNGEFYLEGFTHPLIASSFPCFLLLHIEDEEKQNDDQRTPQ